MADAARDMRFVLSDTARDLSTRCDGGSVLTALLSCFAIVWRPDNADMDNH